MFNNRPIISTIWTPRIVFYPVLLSVILLQAYCGKAGAPIWPVEPNNIQYFPGMEPSYGFNDTRPKIRPGTNEISFTRTANHRYRESPYPAGVYLLDITTFEVRHIADASTFHGDWWSPDTLLYRYYDAWRLLDIETQGWRDILAAVGHKPSVNPVDHSIVFIDGPNLKLLDTSTYEVEILRSGCETPSWQPDGNRIIVPCRALNGYAYQIMILNRYGESLLAMTKAEQHHFQDFPSWDREGRKIVFEDQYPDQGGYLQSYATVIDNTSSVPARVRHLTKGRRPVFDHTGEWIIYSYWSEMNDMEERLFRININSGIIQQLTY